jgi:preprotein translocase subunit SecD
MRERSTRLLLAFVLLLTAFSVFVSFPSNPDRYLPDFIPWPEEECVGPVCIGKGIEAFGKERREMLLGLDLRGGTRLVLEADISQQPDVDLDEALNTAVDIVERRVNAFGVAESITERVGSNRISVQLPGISSEEAVSKIGRTAQLKFMEMARDSNGDILVRQADGSTTTMPLETVLLSAATLENVVYVPVTALDKDGIEREISGAYLNRDDIIVSRDLVGLPLLNFGMNSEGAELLGQATTRLSADRSPMLFFIDDEPIRGADGEIVAPRVGSQIRKQGQISGLSVADAQELSTLLRTGAFPVPLQVVQQDDVDATLGDQAVVHSVQAGLIAIFVVMAFMTLYYRLPGVLASAALFVYVSVTLAVFKLVPVTITSAGMAAFVLSVGMAVDANILIFERMKEELRLGRSLLGAVDAGFSRAWTSIRDSNIATLITCVILYWFGDQFGASLVKGFALTLALGVVVSMFSAITVTRTFLHVLIGTPVMRHLWLFGADVAESRQPVAGPAGLPSPRGQTPRSPEL